MTVNVIVHSRQDLAESQYNDDNLESFPNDYFICINASGFVHKVPHFKKLHDRVLNCYFDDVEQDYLKHDEEFNIDFHAKACTYDQAVQIKKFIDTVPEGATLHVSCTKGKSRSPAIAKFINETKNKICVEVENYNKHVYKLLCQI